MHLFLCAVAVLIAGAAVCLLMGRRKGASLVGAGSCVIASALAITAAVGVLAGNTAEPFDLPWSIPFGSFSVGLDGLSAFFAAIIALVCGLAAVYGVSYLKGLAARKNLGATWFYYNTLAASMLLVVSARNGVLFLIAWEIMSLASFFLVMFEDDKPETLSAGWTYLVATHLGTAFLLAMFVLLSWQDGTMKGSAMDFASLSAASPATAGACFLLALVGFGTKAGLVPFHVWLPQAHPAAPSHVSAVMSGVMIKTGIYGLLRTLTFLHAMPAWWGWVLVGIGSASGIGGVLMALAQHDLKALLAYHSVENIGIITMGLGLGLLGISAGNDLVAVLGIFGALLHVWNHALFKSLLFLGAGAVVHATGIRDIDQMGGLIKRMPTTAATFFVGSASICGLPPLNGFISELAIYLAAFFALTNASSAKTTIIASLVVIASLSLIGGLAAACFAKAFSVVFLGAGRSDRCDKAHEAGPSMRWPMIVLAGLCVMIGLLGPVVILAVGPAVAGLMKSQTGLATIAPQLDALRSIFCYVSLGAVVLLGLAGVVALLRWKLLSGRAVARSLTWDCGYVTPTARMQYTASSFASPILDLFRTILRPGTSPTDMQLPQGLFPSQASLHTHQDDLFLRRVFGGLFGMVVRLSAAMKWLQSGANQLYILYIALAILVLLVWKLGLQP